MANDSVSVQAPAFYPNAFAKLHSFLEGGSRPVTGTFKWNASEQTVAEVTEFLTSAHGYGLTEPDLTLGIDGAVSVVWHTGGGTGDWYISADFSHAAYIYAISQVPGKDVAGLMKCGHSKSNEICADLVEYVKQAYH
jgi:hypothetical protein